MATYTDVDPSYRDERRRMRGCKTGHFAFTRDHEILTALRSAQYQARQITSASLEEDNVRLNARSRHCLPALFATHLQEAPHALILRRYT